MQGILGSDGKKPSLATVYAYSPVAHYKFNEGITVTGAGVSQWDDASGNGNHLLQGTDTNRPSHEADGTILFDGVDNFLKANAFTLNQPTTVYVLGKQVTWTSSERVFDGNVKNTGTLYQQTATPRLTVFAGSNGATSTDVTLDTYFAICSVFNGASSALQVNDTTTTGDAGASNMGGFTLGASGLPDLYGNIQVKEVIVYNTAHDATTRTQIINYLHSV